MRIIFDPNKLYQAILTIIREANSYLGIVSPYVLFEKDNTSLVALREAVNDALNREVSIEFLTRGNDPLAPMNIPLIRSFFNYYEHIYLIPYLHSKIYYNESKALITSLNLSIASLFNQNEESGILIQNKNDSEFYREIIKYISKLKELNIQIRRRTSWK